MASGPLEYGKAFTSRLLTAMSGAASVPFAAMGLWLGEGWQVPLFYGLAALCLVLASYLVWKVERDRADKLSARLQPRISVGAPRIQEAKTSSGDYDLYVQVPVSCATDASIEDCRAHFLSVEINKGLPDEQIFEESGEHKWSLVDVATITLRPGAPHYLNIAAIRSSHGGSLRPVYPTLVNTPLGVLSLLYRPGRFRFHAILSGRNTLSRRLDTTDLSDIKTSFAPEVAR
jgi:hypothetical protein